MKLHARRWGTAIAVLLMLLVSVPAQPAVAAVTVYHLNTRGPAATAWFQMEANGVESFGYINVSADRFHGTGQPNQGGFLWGFITQIRRDAGGVTILKDVIFDQTIGDTMPLVANGPFTQAVLKISVQGYDYAASAPIERPIVLNLQWAAAEPASSYKEHYHGVTPGEYTWSTHIHTRGQGRAAYAAGTFDGVAVESSEATLYQNSFTDIAVFRS